MFHLSRTRSLRLSNVSVQERTSTVIRVLHLIRVKYSYNTDCAAHFQKFSSYVPFQPFTIDLEQNV